MARSNKTRTEQTRSDLIAAGRKLFVERGYAETATPDIVEAAGVTRGALYHHFEDKKALLQAVVEREAAAVAEAIKSAAPRGSTPRAALVQGGEAFLDAMREPGRARILLLDGPAALGVEVMAKIDAQNGGGTLLDGLAEALAAGALQMDLPIGQLAELLSAVYDRAALAISAGGDSRAYRRAIENMISGLVRA